MADREFETEHDWRKYIEELAREQVNNLYSTLTSFDRAPEQVDMLPPLLNGPVPDNFATLDVSDDEEKRQKAAVIPARSNTDNDANHDADAHNGAHADYDAGDVGSRPIKDDLEDDKAHADGPSAPAAEQDVPSEAKSTPAKKPKKARESRAEKKERRIARREEVARKQEQTIRAQALLLELRKHDDLDDFIGHVRAVLSDQADSEDAIEKLDELADEWHNLQEDFVLRLTKFAKENAVVEQSLEAV